MVYSKMDILNLYKMLLREGSKFPSYNRRMYALRRIKSRFQENKSLTNASEIERVVNEGKKSLEIIKRQVIVNGLYKTDKLVVETKT